MPPAKDTLNRNQFAKHLTTSGGTSMSARVYHPATNLMPASPPCSPTGVAPPFPPRSNGHSFSRQNSQNGGKYS